MLNRARVALAAGAFALAPGLITGLVPALIPGQAAADTVNLLVMGEDADLDSVRRHTEIFDRVVQAISVELTARGFAVYDETAVTMEFYDLDRVRRSDAELISLARSVQIVPIDAVTTFQIRVATVPSAYEGITDLRLRLSGRIIEIASGQFLGGYEVSYQPGELPPLPLDCHRDCQIAFVGDQAAIIAHDVGAVLAEKLSQLVQGDPAPGPATPSATGCDGPSNTFALSFSGFDPEDLARIDGFLGAFTGHVGHRPLGAGNTETGYETCAGADRLEANLLRMFEQFGVDVWLEADENGFSAARIAAPGSP